ANVQVQPVSWNNELTGDSFARLGAPAGASVSADIATVATYVDTEVAAIKAKTDNLPSDPADASDIAASFSSIAATLTTIASYIDTEVAAIKAKTDQLTFTSAGLVDANALALDAVVEGAYTLKQYMRAFAAALLGKASGLEGTTAKF